MLSLTKSPIELGEGIYWVGSASEIDHLNCNPYLIVDGTEGVLIDPGSPLDFEEVLSKVTQILPVEQLRYIILQHQDPDFCASTPLFEKHGFRGELATHWRTAHLLPFYGVQSPFYLVNEHRLTLHFGNGRKLLFHPTPYLHFPGAITTYDPVSKTLFSSDLFGAFCKEFFLFAEDWPDGHYLEAMKGFHEHYMPSNEILRPAIESLSMLDIRQIAPQHGSVIRQDIPLYIRTLRDLECGAFLRPIKKKLSALTGYTTILNQVLKRYYSAFPKEQLFQAFAHTDIQLNLDTGMLKNFNCTGSELWNRFFQFIYTAHGMEMLVFIEPLVNKLAAEYDLALPDIFTGTVFSVEKSLLSCSLEKQKLVNELEQIKEKLQVASEKVLYCPITKLPNQQVFLHYLTEECQKFAADSTTGSLLLIGIDNMSRINLQYGHAAGDEILKTLMYLLTEHLPSGHALFKDEGPVFACYLPQTDKTSAIALGEQIRYQIAQSDRMIEQVTVSIGILSLSDFDHQQFVSYSDLAHNVHRTAKDYLNQARRQGMNQVCFSIHKEASALAGNILIADTDEVHLDVLSNLLENAQFSVWKARDGEEALQLIREKQPELIISEVMLPKLDAFSLVHELKRDSATMQTPVILLSFLKNEETIQRAFALDIEHYYPKPYLVPELLGLVLLKFRQRAAAVQNMKEGRCIL